MGTANLQQCHICGKIIGGVGPLKRHIISCKRKLCENCKNNEKCKSKDYWLPCPIQNTNLLSSSKY